VVLGKLSQNQQLVNPSGLRQDLVSFLTGHRPCGSYDTATNRSSTQSLYLPVQALNTVPLPTKGFRPIAPIERPEDGRSAYGRPACSALPAERLISNAALARSTAKSSPAVQSALSTLHSNPVTVVDRRTSV
jgi:hypothetical protein